MHARDDPRALIFALAIGCFACTSPPPVQVGEEDVSAALEIVAARSHRFGPEDFRIASISVETDERAVEMTLVARERDGDWSRVETARCHRAEHPGAWRCFGPYAEEAISLPDGRAISLTDISPAFARDALRFLLRSDQGSPSGVLRVDSLALIADDAIRVGFESVPSHGGVSSGSMILRKSDDGFIVESRTPTNDWFGRPSSGGSSSRTGGHPAGDASPDRR